MSGPTDGAAPPARQHPSLEKTEPCVPLPPADGAARPESREASPGSESSLSDFEALRLTLNERTQSCSALSRANSELKAMVETLHSDFSAQRAEQFVELRALTEALQRIQDEQLELLGELELHRKANKALKGQALSLQHQVNAWGIPVSAAGPLARGPGDPGSCSFPALVSLDASSDPSPTILRGDIASFHVADVLHMLASSRLVGVLTLVTDELASKLYVELGALRLVAWSNSEPELQLASLLEASSLVPPEAMAIARGQSSFDLELAQRLILSGQVQHGTVRLGLQEHAKVILGYLLHAQRGQFYFQPGRLAWSEELLFSLPITSVLLTAAAAEDERAEKSRVSAG